MAEPAAVRWVITAVFVAVTVTCLLRLAATARREDKPVGLPRRHEDFGHVVMALSMIAMVLSWTRLLPTPVWVLLFGGQAVFFGAVLLRRSAVAGWSDQDNWDHTQHMMASIGMIYMVLAIGGTTSAAGMAGMGMASAPLAGAFGVYFLIYAVWSGLRAIRLAPAGVGVSVGWSGLPLVLSRPLAVHGCRALMGGGMAYLLLTA